VLALAEPRDPRGFPYTRVVRTTPTSCTALIVEPERRLDRRRSKVNHWEKAVKEPGRKWAGRKVEAPDAKPQQLSSQLAGSVEELRSPLYS
jgi:hypothetical protein